jgi:hypothetical protein
MTRTCRTLWSFFLVGVLLCGVVRLAASQEDPNLSGTLTVTATSVAVGVGWSWGEGTLTLLNGKQYRFKVSGLDVVAVGFKQATAVGKVYYLRNVRDFEGTYTAATAGITVGGGVGASTLQNQRGVVMNLTGVGQGVDVRLAVSGMTVKLIK